MKLERANLKKQMLQDGSILYTYTCNDIPYHIKSTFDAAGKKVVYVYRDNEIETNLQNVYTTHDNIEAWSHFESLLEQCAPQQDSSGGFMKNPQQNPKILPLLALVPEKGIFKVTLFMLAEDGKQTVVGDFEIGEKDVPYRSKEFRTEVISVDWSNLDIPDFFKTKMKMKFMDHITFETDPNALVFMFIPESILQQGGDEGESGDGGDGEPQDSSGDPMQKGKTEKAKKKMAQKPSKDNVQEPQKGEPGEGGDEGGEDGEKGEKSEGEENSESGKGEKSDESGEKGDESDNGSGGEGDEQDDSKDDTGKGGEGSGESEDQPDNDEQSHGDGSGGEGSGEKDDDNQPDNEGNGHGEESEDDSNQGDGGSQNEGSEGYGNSNTPHSSEDIAKNKGGKSSLTVPEIVSGIAKITGLGDGTVLSFFSRVKAGETFLLTNNFNKIKNDLNLPGSTTAKELAQQIKDYGTKSN